MNTMRDIFLRINENDFFQLRRINNRIINVSRWLACVLILNSANEFENGEEWTDLDRAGIYLMGMVWIIVATLSAVEGFERDINNESPIARDY